jgi:hypothetical protein
MEKWRPSRQQLSVELVTKKLTENRKLMNTDKEEKRSEPLAKKTIHVHVF